MIEFALLLRLSLSLEFEPYSFSLEDYSFFTLLLLSKILILNS